jgi:dienelactone hydrolase
MGHLHTPSGEQGEARDIAVVICPPPFGYENICSHRALRILGDRLAGGGIASLRFDVPGTGDSDGQHDLRAWKKAIAVAAATVRRETGCTKVAAIGIGLAGTVLLGSMDEGLDLDKVIVWGTPVRGRAWLRQQRAYALVAAPKPHPDAPPPPPMPEGVEELTGFPLKAALAAELSALDAGKVPADAWPADRPRPLALALARSAADTDEALAKALGARGMTVTSEAYTGFDQMLDEPHLAKAPEPIFARIREWLAEGVPNRAPFPAQPAGGNTATTRIGGSKGQVEEIARYSPGDGGLLFSIETRPVGRAPNPTWLVFLTGRAVRHVGPNRMWVRFARELAAEGYASLRLDGRSVGDSEGEGNGLMPNAEYYQEHIYDDVERVMEIAVARGCKQFLMTGICSGATASYQVAWRRSDVAAIVLLNPLQLRHDPEDDDRAKVQRASEWLLRKDLWTNPKSYLRLLKGELPKKKMLKAVFSWATITAPFRRKAEKKNEPSYVVTGFHDLADKKRVEIDIFVSEGDDSVPFLERHFGAGLRAFDRGRLRLHREHNTDHTIKALFAQERYRALLRTALARVAEAGQPSARVAE